MTRPYVLLSAAVSVDGYLDDASEQRLMLSDAADLDRVDAVRAGCDAILVGAQTVRKDNPGLRVRRGQPGALTRVTLTASGDLDPAARFFAADGAPRLVYVPGPLAVSMADRLGPAATVIGGDDPLTLPWLLADLAGRGVRRLMVEGGAGVLGQFLAAGLADELQLAIAPLFVADAAAPRLLTPPPGGTSWRSGLELTEVSQVGRMAVLRFGLIPEKD
jgi:5-amino-6-(5-phosphoribosylamino)uracil reductase